MSSQSDAVPAQRPGPAPAGRLPTPRGQAHVEALRVAIDGFGACLDVAEKWGRHLADVLPSGGRVLAAGNGGSAAQAQHLTAELVGRYRDERRPFSAIALGTEICSLTAIGNDYGLTEVFARQVQAHARPGDVCVLMSTSGTSPNVIAAAERARALGITTWAFTGPLPNPLAQRVDEVLAVDAPYTATVQELHLVGLHVLCAALDAALGGGS